MMAWLFWVDFSAWGGTPKSRLQLAQPHLSAVHLPSFRDSRVTPTPRQLDDLWVALQALAARFHLPGVINDTCVSVY